MPYLNNISAGWHKYFDSVSVEESDKLTAKLQFELIVKESHRLFSGQGEIEEWQNSGSKKGNLYSGYK